MFRGDHFQSFLVSLAHAELAAAKQCRLIAQHFEERGNLALASLYSEFSDEERSHFERISRLCTNPSSEVSKRAKEAYESGFMTDDCSVVERMIAVHLVFEPSALAFLGHVAKNAKNLGSEDDESMRVRNTFRSILREEIGHVYSGSKLIKQLLPTLSKEARRSITRTVRKQRCFLRSGIKTFFADRPEMVSEMVSRYDFYFRKQIKGVLNDRLEVVA